tara:strand:- start:218 stop:1060 length:843 start_codon:yes stop_codon:yes gene_type:complete
MNYKKFSHSYKRTGLIGIINVLLGKIGIKSRFKNSIELRVIWIANYIKRLTNNIVNTGLYKGMKIHNDTFWSQKDISTRLLGLYELEVQNIILKIQSILKLKKKYLINIGGGDGYHAVGLLRSKVFRKAIIFEIDSHGQDIININLHANKQKNKAIILGEAKNNFLTTDLRSIKLNDCFFLIDIEGAEYTLLNKKNLDKLSNSILLVELHATPKKSFGRFMTLLKKNYNTKTFYTESRDLSKIDFMHHLEDNDRWLAVSEHRSGMMSWIVCIPKKNKFNF